MNNGKNDSEDIKKRLARLEQEVSDIFKILKIESLNTTEHIEVIHEYLGPMLRKVFPGIETGQRDVRAFLASLRKSKDNGS